MNTSGAHDARLAVEAAQDLAYDAWDANGARRVRLARKALDLSEDCADAYVILAEAARSRHEARVLNAEGCVRASARWGRVSST